MSNSQSIMRIYGTNLDDDLIGSNMSEHFWGLAGTDRIYAKGGDDILYGNEGNDLLDGGEGRDLMYGGSGNDTYRVDNVADVVSEESAPGVDDGGIDTVKSTISFSLGAFIEKLILSGSADIDGFGNDLDNNIKGNGANNALSGGAGSDTLYGYAGDDILYGGTGRDYYYGGEGADTFVFNYEPGDWDRAYDFTAEDKIGIIASDYGLAEGAGLTGGVLSADYFVAGTAATAIGHGQFVYNAAKSELLWDPDGAGGAKAVRVALVTASTPITATQIQAFGESATVSVVVSETGPIAENDCSVYFTLSLSQPVTEDVILTVSTVNGTAEGGADFTALSSVQVVVLAGQTTVHVPVEILNDELGEADEAFSLRIDTAILAASGVALPIVGPAAQAVITDDSPTIVAEHDMAAIGMTDPSAIAYNPFTNSLLMADSEVDEEPFFQANNFFTLELDGSLTSSTELRFTDEPTGLAFDASRGVMYITDDDEYRVYAVSASNPNRVLYSFDTLAVGCVDPEDIAVDATTGNLFIVNGLTRTVVEVNRTGTTVISSFVLPDEILDPEALAFDSNSGEFYVGGGFSDQIWKLDRDGTVIDVISVLEDAQGTGFGHRVNVKDIELAPASDGSGDMHLYVADYGWSHVADGRLFEIDPGDVSPPVWDIA